MQRQKNVRNTLVNYAKLLNALMPLIIIILFHVAIVLSVGPSSTKPLKVIRGIQNPSNLATGRNGEIVVASFLSHSVHIYNSDYQHLRTFGTAGYMDGQFMCPSGIAVDHQNRIFVSSMTKVDVFTMEGQFLNSVGQQGNGPLQFTNAAGITIGKEGQIYVADAQNNRIQILNNDLTYCTSFCKASESLGSGQLCMPQAIAINSEGNLYVADMMNHAIQVFTPEGEFLFKFGKYGPAIVPGSVCSPFSLAIDRQDNVYVGNGTGNIAIFDKQGNFLRQFGSYGSELGQFNTIKGVHIDRKGHLYVSEWTSNRIQIFPGSPSMVSPEEEIEDTVRESESESTKTLGPSSKPAYLIGPKSTTPLKILPDIKTASGIAVGKDGEIIVASWSEHRVLVYSARNDYQLITEIGEEGHFDGEFICPSGVAVTPDNYILVSSDNKLQWFTMEGKLVHAVGGQGTEKMEFNNPTDVSVGIDGRIYVLDSKNGRVQIINGDATYHSSFTLPQPASEEDNKPLSALAVNSEGSVYLTDPNQNCVHVLSSNGEPQFKFGKSGSWMDRGVLTAPMAIAIDSEDNVFVGSVLIASIFDKSGVFIRAFGGPGSAAGQFNLIYGLHVDRFGKVYVSEFANNRVQIFEGSAEPGTPSKVAKTTDIAKAVSLLHSHKPAYLIGPSSKSPIKILSQIPEVSGIAEGRNGEIIVISKKESRVFIYNSKDHYQRMVDFGGNGCQDGKFKSPQDVAVTSENLVLVSSEDKLQWFTMDGKLVHAVGGKGTEKLKFVHPTRIAISKEGYIHVIDAKNKRVQTLNGNATYNSSFGFPHLTSSRDESPCAIAVNSEGTLYFADSKNNCIRVCSPSGELLYKLGKSGHWTERGTVNYPAAIAIDSEDNVFVADYYKLLIFDKSGCLIREFGGKFNRISDLCVGRNGYLYVSDSSNDCVYVFEGSQPAVICSHEPSEFLGILSSRRPIFTVGPSSDEPVKILSNIAEPWGVSTASNGDVYVVSRKEKKVLVYNSQNYDFKEEISKLYWKTSRDNEITCPTGIAICEDGCLLLNLKHQLAKFTRDGDVIASVGKKGRAGRSENELDSPNGIALGEDGRVYAVDAGNRRVQIFNPDLTYNSTSHYPDTSERPEFKKIAINSHGCVYITDSRNHCIHVFSKNGKYLFNFGRKGTSSDRGTLSSPVAIAIDHEDYIYVSGDNFGVSIFDREGNFVRAFGVRGDKSGEFKDITAMHINHNGYLYVCESRNNRLQIFAGIKSHSEGERDRVAQLDKEEAKLVSTLPVTTLPDAILGPRGVGEGMNGEIVVVSSLDNKVFVYDHSCKLVTQFGDKGVLDGYFQNPTGVAITSDNYILVSSHDKLQWFTMEGQLVYAVGSSGKGELEFNHPDDISVDRDGKIYILEKQNKRVQVLHGNGTYCSSFSFSKNDYPPEALAVNSEGKIFLADTRNHCIRVFSSDGVHLLDISSMGSKELAPPTAIAIDNRDNSIYAGNVSGLVATFDGEGCFTGAFRGSGDVPGQFNVIRGLHIGQHGHIYVSDFTSNRVQVFGQQNPSVDMAPSQSPPANVLPYRPVFTIGPKSSVPVKILTGIKRPCAVTTDSIGNILIASDGDGKILIYGQHASQPRMEIKEIENPRDPRNKKLSSPSSLAFTTDGFLLVSFKHQLVKMSQEGRVEKWFGNEKNRRGKNEDELDDPGGIAVGTDQRIYVVDRGNHRIQILQSDFECKNSYFNPDEKERRSEYVENVALNSAEELFVTDRHNDNIQVFSPKGRFLFTFGKKAKSREYIRGALSSPNGIAIDREDFIYVGGRDGVVSIFDRKGNFVRSFGGTGDQPGQFRGIIGMHVDHQGQLYVCDGQNNRVQVFQ